MTRYPALPLAALIICGSACSNLDAADNSNNSALEDSTQLGATSGSGTSGSSAVVAAGGMVAGEAGGAAAGGSSGASDAVAGMGGGAAAGGSSTVAGLGGAGPGGAGLDTAGQGGTGGAAVGESSGVAGTGGRGGMAGASGGGLGGTAGNPAGGSAAAESGGAANAGAGGGGDQPTSCTPARAHDSGRAPVDIQHDGNNRDYVLFVPTGYDGTEPLPLVVNLHGGGSFATEELDRSKWDKMGEQENFVVVAPNGLNMSWNAGFGDDGRDDVGFIRAVVQDIASELCIDERRVYVSGHSNGGAMTHKVGCEAADLFAAMAPICGWLDLEATCNPPGPISVAAVRAFDDRTVPYDGGSNNMSAAEDLQVWLDANECDDMPVVTSHDGTCTTHTSCVDGRQVMECHPPGSHGFYYASNNQFLLPEVLWPFFEQFTLP